MSARILYFNVMNEVYVFTSFYSQNYSAVHKNGKAIKKKCFLHISSNTDISRPQSGQIIII